MLYQSTAYMRLGLSNSARFGFKLPPGQGTHIHPSTSTSVTAATPRKDAKCLEKQGGEQSLQQNSSELGASLDYVLELQPGGHVCVYPHRPVDFGTVDLTAKADDDDTVALPAKADDDTQDGRGGEAPGPGPGHGDEQTTTMAPPLTACSTSLSQAVSPPARVSARPVRVSDVHGLYSPDSVVEMLVDHKLQTVSARYNGVTVYTWPAPACVHTFSGSASPPETRCSENSAARTLFGKLSIQPELTQEPPAGFRQIHVTG